MIGKLARVCLCVGMAALFAAASHGDEWWKGNTHTHSMWSDGDDYPEMIVDWYREHEYNFLMLSDHNVLSIGQRWINPAKSRGGVNALEKYIVRFGDEWVETRDRDGVLEARLKPLNEFRSLFEKPDKFLLIQGEEITDNFHDAKTNQNLPIHLNGVNLIEYIMPRGGDSVKETLQNDINAVMEQRERTGQPMFPHINHPNFGWAITAEDIMALDGEKFFEIYNGHPSVHNDGDASHLGTERMWDVILSKRLGELNKPVMYGIATDDSHNYHQFGAGESNSGRGWVMVKAPRLTPEAIVTAMERGDFYASTGVTLNGVDVRDGMIRIMIKPEKGENYTTKFIGTRKGAELDRDSAGRYSGKIGEVFSEVEGNFATYRLSGDELYVRAVVYSNTMMDNPVTDRDVKRAWTQPVIP
ncbi:MAG: histidinol-phosphatase [bacterium]|nr:histidinol-phosphatase [bacterium]